MIETSTMPNSSSATAIADLLASAADHLKAARPGDAIAPLREASLLEPSNAVVLHDLGLACLEVNQMPDAIASLRQAVAANPGYTDAHFRLGIALEKSGD